MHSGNSEQCLSHCHGFQLPVVLSYHTEHILKLIPENYKAFLEMQTILQYKGYGGHLCQYALSPYIVVHYKYINMLHNTLHSYDSFYLH